MKFHGDFAEDDSIVLTESQYLNRLDFESPLDVKLRADLLERSALFIGCSLADINIRYMLYKLNQQWSSSGLGASMPSSFVFLTRPNAVQEQLLQNRGVYPIVAETDDPGEGLRAFLQGLLEAKRANELSAMATSYIPNPEFMRLAIQEAQSAKSAGDYAIGAVVVRGTEVVASSGNRVKIDSDPTQHAEVAAIRKACESLKSRHIEGAILYTTAEPCPMCASTAIWARMAGIVSGSTIEDMAEFREMSGNSGWTWRTVDIAARAVLDNGDPKLFLTEGFLRDECRALFHES